jgi:hypothetical protein
VIDKGVNQATSTILQYLSKVLLAMCMRFARSHL